MFEDLEKKKAALTEIAAGRNPESIPDILANQVIFRELQRVNDQLNELTGEGHATIFHPDNLKARGDLLKFAQERLNCLTLKEMYHHVEREVFPSFLIRSVINRGMVTDYAFVGAIMKGYPELAKEAEGLPGGTGAFFKYCRILESQGKLEDLIHKEQSRKPDLGDNQDKTND